MNLVEDNRAKRYQKNRREKFQLNFFNNNLIKRTYFTNWWVKDSYWQNTIHLESILIFLNQEIQQIRRDLGFNHNQIKQKSKINLREIFL